MECIFVSLTLSIQASLVLKLGSLMHCGVWRGIFYVLCTMYYVLCIRASLIAKLVKSPPAMQETLVRFLGREDMLEKGIGYPLQYSWACLVAQLANNTPAMRETWV